MDSPSRENAAQMFDRIAERYDFLNRILSFGLDVYWRKKFIEFVPDQKGLRILDIATGTADVLVEVCRKRDVATVIGIDPSLEMMKLGQEKLKRFGFENIVLQRGEAEELPFVEETFDVVTISFGIRNTKNMRAALREMYRVLTPGGTALVLEFSMPMFSLIKPFHRFYLRHILPTIGGFISGNKDAYVYLNKTIETFPYGQDFLRVMEESGFSQTKATPLNFGIVTIYKGQK